MRKKKICLICGFPKFVGSDCPRGCDEPVEYLDSVEYPETVGSVNPAYEPSRESRIVSSTVKHFESVFRKHHPGG
jgi:hypothetical protein